MRGTNSAFTGLLTDSLTSLNVFGQLWLNNMFIKLRDLLFFGSLASTAADAQCPQSNGTVDLSWHRPNQININNFSFVVNGTGANGFYNTSVTPATAAYSTYNWCNMPHVRQEEYVKAAQGYKLEYVELVRY
jgi:acid phosphatase